MNYVWRNNPNIVARLVNTKKILTISNHEIVLKPNEACALIVDGKIGDIITETLVKNMAGGFNRWVGDKFGLTAKDRRLLFAMTSPMDYWIPFEGNLATGEKVIGSANLRMRIDLENVPKLLNYFSNNTTTLTRDDVIRVVATELYSRVVSPMISSCKSITELRSLTTLNKFELTTEVQMKNLLANFGFTLMKAFPNFNQTESENIKANVVSLEFKSQQNESVINSVIAGTKQKEKLRIAEIESNTNLAKAEARGSVQIELETELKQLHKIEAVLDANLNHQERQNKIMEDVKNSKANRAMKLFSKVQEEKAKRIAKQIDSKRHSLEILTKSQIEFIQIAAENGVLTPDVILELLRQQTSQKEIESKTKTVD